MVNVFRKFLSSKDVHFQELIKGSAAAFGVKVFAALAAFIFNVFIARLLGAGGSGIFFLASTIIAFAATLSRVGMENVLVRSIAADVASSGGSKVSAIYRKVLLYPSIVSVFAVLIVFLSSSFISGDLLSKPELEHPLALMSLAIPALALLALHAHALQGLRKSAASVSVLSVFTPIFGSVLAVAVVPSYGVQGAVVAFVVSAFLTLVVGRVFWVKYRPSLKNAASNWSGSDLFARSMPLFAIVVLNQVITWSPMIFLGVWETNENIGIFSAATRTAMLTSFVLVAVNTIAAPKFAALHEIGDKEGLGRLARSSAILMMALAFPILVFFTIFPEWTLSIFGEQFRVGANVLTILAVGQYVNVATGSVGYLLIMSGNEKVMRNNLFVSASLGLLLSIVLIPRFGVVGAAISASVTLSLQNIIAYYLVRKRLGISIYVKGFV